MDALCSSCGLGPFLIDQKVTLTVFSLVCFLWVFKGVIHHLVGFSFLNDTSVALPVLMSLAVSQGMSPLLMGIPAALCSSFAFSMPVSTPPNAIVFATDQVRVSHMLKAGMILNVIGLISVMSVGWFLMKWVL